MTVGAWDPNQAQQADNFSIDHDVLKAFIALSEQQQLNDLKSTLNDDIKISQAPLMKLSKDTWIKTAESLSDEQVIHLVKFFTLAEMQLSGWEAGAESPVIGLVKALRLRKSPPDKELLLWIKSNSDNRFLPNGAL
ncbi:hypothetical protein KOI40_14200 [Aestuariicella sp. G3-2]|uniref:hypothetical protein n=1 Tax=Pseudomaricurvus albidus TaxID=2842452 RepID=UPI001C0D3B5E|nr:hypothetical protein [Aestuariicella albida]MBU3070972.1 hypothetical protein [Aestuariicella albida]